MDSSFLGRGWKFPIEVDRVTGRIVMSEHEDDIAEAIRIIVRTSKGERVMRPDFGCNVDEFLFGPMDETTLSLMGSNIQEAIRDWEPRVEDVEVIAEPDPRNSECMLVRVSYRVRTTNNQFNQVYPFYLDEGVR